MREVVPADPQPEVEAQAGASFQGSVQVLRFRV